MNHLERREFVFGVICECFSKVNVYHIFVINTDSLVEASEEDECMLD
jgi:hypothetical protein